MRTGGRSHSASSRSSESIRCEPRLLPATACSSSTITLLTDFSIARPDSELSRMYSDSGVVTRMCGGVRRMRSRSAAGVSPVRTAARMPTSGRPIATSPALNAGQRLLQVLADVVGKRLQRRHVEHVDLVREPLARPSRTSSSMADRKAASVLPEPVGAAIERMAALRR